MTYIEINNVNTLTQRDDTIYNFTLSAESLMEICRVERFGVDPNGVNRRYDENHAMDIATAMLNPTIVWMESILGDLTGGSWIYDPENRVLRGSEKGYISIDDGQHRFMALSVLNATERTKLEFTVQVTLGLSYERRLKIFRMQKERKVIDPRLDLAQRHRLGEWKTEGDREAYELLLKLNADTTSPLRGVIILEEQDKRPYEGRHRPIGINGKGLHSTLRSVMGGKSPLAALSSAERARVILDTIRLSAQIWLKEWKSDSFIITTARGMNALLNLYVSSPNFRGALGDDFSHESIERALRLAETFKWSASGFKNVGVREIVSRLDQSIGKNQRAAAKARVA
jgi:hypothetical protein